MEALRTAPFEQAIVLVVEEGEEHLLLLLEVLLKIDECLFEEVLYLVELGVSIAMHTSHLGHERRELGCTLTNATVVYLEDVVYEEVHGPTGKVGYGTDLGLHLFERTNYLIFGYASRGTSLGKGRIAVATKVYLEAVEHVGGRKIIGNDLAYSLLLKMAHSVITL